MGDKSEAAVVNPQLGAQEHGLYSSSPSGRPANGTQYMYSGIVIRSRESAHGLYHSNLYL